MPLRAQGRGRSSLLAYGSKPSAATPLCAILSHFPRGSRLPPPRDDLEITLPRFPVFIAPRNKKVAKWFAKEKTLICPASPV